MSSEQHKFLLLRHGKKFEPNGILKDTVFYDSAVILDNTGDEQMQTLGRDHGRDDFDYFQFVSSGTLRGILSTMNFAIGANNDHNNLVEKLQLDYRGDDVISRKEPALAIDAYGMDLDHPALDSIIDLWDSGNPTPFNCELYMRFFGQTSHDPRVPVMGLVGAETLNVIHRSMAFAKNIYAQTGKSSLTTIISHAGNLHAPLLIQEGISELTPGRLNILNKSHQPFYTGAGLAGFLHDVTSDDPQLVLHMTQGDTEKEYVLGYKNLIEVANKWAAYVKQSKSSVNGVSPYVIPSD